MRTRWVVLVLVALAAAWWAWPYHGAYKLEQAAAARDPAALSERIDFPAVRKTLAKQVIRAYLRQSGQGDKLGPLGRGMALAVGTSVADPYLAELISPDSLAAILADGHLRPLQVEGRTVTFDTAVPRLADVLGHHLLPVLLSSYYDGPTRFVFHAADPEGAPYGIHLQLDGLHWRLAGIDLPQPLLDRIAADIIARDKAKASS